MFLAWGVSPRYPSTPNIMSPRGATDCPLKCELQRSSNHHLSPLRGSVNFFCPGFWG